MEVDNKKNNFNPKVHIVIVNYNCWSYTVACISSILKSTYTNSHILIVDNQSSDNSILEIEKWATKNQIFHKTVSGNQEKLEAHLTIETPLITIINSSENKGFGAGNNIALKPLLKTSKNEFIWLLNPDTEVEPSVLQDMVDIAAKKRKTIIGNLIYYFNDRDNIMYYGGFKVKKWIHGIIDVKKEEDKAKIDAIAGASLFTNISTFRDLGVLPENYFMYWEETDFCTNAKRKGYDFDINVKSKIFDHVGVTSKTNFLREYLYLLNGLKYYKKYHPLKLITILLSTLAKFVKALFFDDKTKTKAIYFAHIDFFKLLLGNNINVKERIKNNS